MRLTQSACCVRAPTSHATALPSPAMNCRRFIDHLLGGEQNRFGTGKDDCGPLEPRRDLQEQLKPLALRDQAFGATRRKDPCPIALTCLRLGPTRQFPVWPGEMAGVAVREILQVVLMLGLSLPEGIPSPLCRATSRKR